MADSPVEVGLIGAGPWAQVMHAPVLAAGPETRLAAVWARRKATMRNRGLRHKCTIAATRHLRRGGLMNTTAIELHYMTGRTTPCGFATAGR
jgi:hypothetical protein